MTLQNTDVVAEAHLAGFMNGYEEGFEIGKAQCETHHEEMLRQERRRLYKLLEKFCYLEATWYDIDHAFEVADGDSK
jgi:hypothetical protein